MKKIRAFALLLILTGSSFWSSGQELNTFTNPTGSDAPLLATYNSYFWDASAVGSIENNTGSLYAAIGNNTIGTAQIICNNTAPLALTGSLPTGGTGVFTYQWQSSTVSAIAGFANLAGATAINFAPGSLLANTWYRRIVASGGTFDTTAAIQITVNPIINHASNAIATAQTICFNTAPALITGGIPTGGDGTAYSYQWQSSPDNISWTNLPGANTINYASPALTATLYLRRVVYSGGCTDNSAGIKITVSATITNNIISNNQSICSAQTPLGLTGTNPGGGSGVYTYQWLSSISSATNGFAVASGTVTGINYTPPSLSQTTWFRRVVNSGNCTDTSAAIAIAVYNAAPGNPAVFGNNVWNVYAYSDAAFASYAGFYTEPGLSFISTSRFFNTQSSSSAVGYQGCLVPTTNFSVSYKRTNFTPHYYQIDLTAIDDNFYLLINGIQVYSRGCCTAPPTVISNIWTGLLGATDQVEIRWTQGGGPSQIGANFTVVPAPVLLPGSIGNNQSACTGEVPATGFLSLAAASGCSQISYQWQKSIDSSSWTNIPGATALTYTESGIVLQNTWYRRTVTDACNNAAATVPVKITVFNAAPGDPSIYGNNVWNAYAYNFPSGNNNFSAAVYKGYYIEPSLSFNSTSRWPNGGSPSVASGYQGCYVNPSNNWVVYKRTNFAPAIYQLDIPAHDDFAFLYVNGVLVFQHQGCCDAHTNVWTGPLAATDLVEFRVQQMFGGSYGAITLTPVTPAPLTPGTLSPSQTICAGNIPSVPLAESVAPSGGCSIKSYSWQSSTDNGVSWTNISGSNSSTYTIPNSIYTQTLFRRTITDYCGNTATAVPDTIYMNATAPGNPAVFGNNTWNVYCFQDVNYAIYAGYYTEPLLSFNTTTRYSALSTPSAASGYQGCQLLNTYYSVSMKRTGFTPGLYQIDITGTDDYAILFINGVQVASLTCCTPVNNVWTGNIAATDQIELRWRNNAGPGNTGLRFTLSTPASLVGGSIAATNPNLCYNDVPIITSTTLATGGCFINYSWQSSIDGGVTWNTVVGASGSAFTGNVAPSGNIQFRRVATDVCGNTASSNPVSFIQGAGALGNPSVFGNGQWNVYAYAANGNSFSSAVYLGYYTEPSLSFNSMNRWSSNGSPSDASGYQGCLVDHQNHWVSYRRTNFTSGIYQMDMTNHDDWVYVFVNGTLVFSHVGCCDTHNNIWTGTLGPTDQVEFRWIQFFGGTNGGMNLTLITAPTNINAGTIGTNQTICNNSIPAAINNLTLATDSCFVTYQWQYSTGCTGGWTSIPGANGTGYSPTAALTANTCYRRVAMDACGNTAYSNVITVTVNTATLTAPVIAGNQTICSGLAPAVITTTVLPTGGDGVFSYQWESSPDNIVWSAIAGATTTSLTSGVVFNTIYYRLTATACGGSSKASSIPVPITVSQPPAVAVQPANLVACLTKNTTVSVTATGTGLSYQWQLNTGTGWNNVVNGVHYANASTNTLSVNAVLATMSGYQFRVVLNGTCNPSVTSSVATLSISPTPSISVQPINSTTCIGSTTSFNVTASGSGLSYQWQQKVGAGAWINQTDGGIYTGSNTPSLVLTGVTAPISGTNYRCIITSSCAGTATSNTAVLTVSPAIVNTIGADQTLCAGTSAAQLTGNSVAGYTYLWQSSTVSSSTGFVNATGVNNGANYTPAALSTTTYYQRIVTSGGCSSSSNVVTLTYNPVSIAIGTQPANQLTCSNGNATFSVAATGPGTLSYQWYQYNGASWTALSDGGIYSGSLTNTLSITGVAVGMNNYKYYVKIFSSGCSTSTLNSNTVTLTISTDPVITYTNPDIHPCDGAWITVTVAATGVGLTYQWQQNTGTGWINLPNYGVFSNVNTTNLGIAPITAALTGSQYRCLVTGTCTANTVSSGTITVTVDPPISNNSIAASQVLCSGIPTPLIGSTPTGGNGVYTYQWLQNTGTGWANIPGAAGINYAPGSLSQTTQFQRYVNSGSCGTNGSTAITITINPPTSITNPVNKTVCANSNASFTATGTAAGLAYQWQVDNGSGTFVNIDIANVQYTGATASTLTVINAAIGMNGYRYKCIATGNCGPAAAVSNPATLLVVDPNSLITAPPLNAAICQGGNVSYSVTTAVPGLTYQWMEKKGAGAFLPVSNAGIYSGATTPTLTISGATFIMNGYQYLCVVTAGSCAVNSGTANLTVSQPPVASILYAGSPYCATGNATVQLTGQANGSFSAPAGLVIDPNTGTINLSASVPGNYSITYSFVNGSCSNTSTTNISINALPTATIAYPGSPYCAIGNATVQITGTANGTFSAPAALVINAGTGFIDLAASTPGTYTVTYNFTNGTCSNSTTTSITINALPTATIAYTGSPYCATGNTAVQITGIANGTFSAPAALAINAATGLIDLAASTPGTYTVTYNFTNGTCSNTTTTSVTINALPAATIAYQGSPYCATGNATVQITGTANGTFSAPAALAINAATGLIDLAASTPGTYTVTYNFTNGTCSNFTTTSITINALPTATIAYPGSPYCATGNATVQLTGTANGTFSSPAGLLIDPNTGTIDLLNSTVGTHTVTYSFNNGSCSNTTTTSITINALPTASIAYPGSPYCATGNATVQLTGTANGTYSAPAGLVIDPNTGTIDLLNSTAGTYTVTYSFNNGSCSNTTTTSVTINALPTATIAYQGSPYCATGNATVQLTGTINGNFTAAAGLVLDPNTGTVNLASSVPSTYTIVYHFTNGTCLNTTSTTITINALPTASIGYSGSPYCANGLATVQLTGTSNGVFSSTAGLMIDPNTGSIDLSASIAGTYVVSYNFSNGTCGNKIATQLSINPLPQITIHDPAPVCAPGTIDLTAAAIVAGSTGATAYKFWMDANASVVVANPTKINASGAYYITGISAAGCSSLPAKVNITINPDPVIAISSNLEICKGSQVLLSANAAGSTINWSNGSTGNNITVSPEITTTYTAIATNVSGCSSKATVTVTVDDFKIQLTANPNPILAGTQLQLNTSSNFNYQVLSWTPQPYFQNQTATSQSFILSDSSVVFTVIGQSSIGCLDTSSIAITVLPNTRDFFIPNAFTPNNDGNNDVYKVYGSSIKELHLMIYNQWGQLIFETNTVNKGWDGSINGHPQPVGVYLFAVKAVLYNGNVIQKKGTLNLIR